jgi:hypothetical protein
LVNLLSGHSSWAFYHPLDVLLEALALSLLSSVLGASAGVLISLRSATVRQAQQISSIASELCLIVELFPVSAPSESRDCHAGCDLAGIVTGEFPTLALDRELRLTLKRYIWKCSGCHSRLHLVCRAPVPPGRADVWAKARPGAGDEVGIWPLRRSSRDKVR